MQLIEFDQMLRTRHHDIKLAYQFHNAVSSKGFTKPEFKRIMKSVTSCSLTDGQVDAIFSIFDTDQDGNLHQGEFCDVLEARSNRGLKEGREVVGIRQWMDKFTDCLTK